jgi:hypothetical protein
MNDLICRDTPTNCDASRSKSFHLIDEVTKFEQACKKALDLAKRLGNGWSAIVWENVGWHYDVRSPCKRITVTERTHGKSPTYYSACLHPPGETGSRLRGSTGSTPQAAIKAAIKEVRKEMKYWADLVEGL